MSLNEITVTATDISRQPNRDNDSEVSATVMRSCTFLVIRRNGRTVAHVDISREDWQKLASTPSPDEA